jgi:hypothetical protein
LPDVEKFTNTIFEVEVDNLIKEPRKIQLLIKQVLEKNRNETREPFGTKMAEMVAKNQAKCLRAEEVVQLEILVFFSATNLFKYFYDSLFIKHRT